MRANEGVVRVSGAAGGDFDVLVGGEGGAGGAGGGGAAGGLVHPHWEGPPGSVFHGFIGGAGGEGAAGGGGGSNTRREKQVRQPAHTCRIVLDQFKRRCVVSNLYSPHDPPAQARVKEIVERETGKELEAKKAGLSYAIMTVAAIYREAGYTDSSDDDNAAGAAAGAVGASNQRSLVNLVRARSPSVANILQKSLDETGAFPPQTRVAVNDRSDFRSDEGFIDFFIRHFKKNNADLMRRSGGGGDGGAGGDGGPA